MAAAGVERHAARKQLRRTPTAGPRMTDADQRSAPSAEAPDRPAAPLGPRLVRPRHGRLLGGVSGAFAAATGLDRALVRIGLVVTAIFGGFGLVLYLLGWLALPSEGEAEAPLERTWGRVAELPRAARLLIGAVVVLVLLDAAGDEVGVGAAVALVLVGALLLHQDTLAQRRAGTLPAPVPRLPVPPPPGTAAAPSVAATPIAAPMASPTARRLEQPIGAGSEQGPATRAPLTTPGYGGWTPPPRPADIRRPPSMLGRITIGCGLLVLGAAAVLDATGLVHMGLEEYLGLALLGIGSGLVVGAFAGRARWLALLGLLLIPPLGATRAVDDLDLDLSGGAGDRTVRVTEAADLADSYRLGVGSMVLDLRRLELPPGGVATVQASVAVGQLVVRLPPDVSVEGLARVRGGAIELPDGTSVAGPAERTISVRGEEGDGRIELDLESTYGRIDVEQSR